MTCGCKQQRGKTYKDLSSSLVTQAFWDKDLQQNVKKVVCDDHQHAGATSS